MSDSTAEPKPRVELYTDGACSGNPGPGGWAYIMRHPDSGKEIERNGGEPETTNNRMELIALIEGLESLNRPAVVEVYSDSQYVINGLKQWLDGWKKKNWMRAGRKPVLNIDLWKKLDSLRNTHDLHLNWVRGHNDHPENERADRLAVAAIEQFR